MNEKPQLHKKTFKQLSVDELYELLGKKGTSEFSGEWIEFGSERFPDWQSVLDYLIPEQ